MSKFKVGDRVVRTDIGDQVHGVVKGEYYSVESVDNTWISLKGVNTREKHAWNEGCFELAKEGPVRIKTVTEIVEGVYGRLSIKQQGGDEPRLMIALANLGGHVEMVHHGWSLDELSDAIANLTAIRDALQEQDK